MPERSLQRMTLWELVAQCERLCRELVEHYRTDYIPRLQELQRLLQPKEDRDEVVADTTVANSVRRVAQSEQYARQRLERLELVMNEMLRRTGRSR